MHDLIQAFRSLRRTPFATAAAALTLALAIGANSALFTLLDVALIRPLPFWDPDRLALVESVRPESGEADQSSAADFLEWRRESRAFQSLAAWRDWGMALTGRGEPEDLETVRVTANLFEVLGVAPALGRSFAPAEELPGHRVTIVSDGFWRERLGGDPAAVGQTVNLDGNPYTVIGVMPAGFRFPDRDGIRLWTPMAFDSTELSRRAQRMFDVIGRLNAGVTLSRGHDELAALTARLPVTRPSDAAWTVRLRTAPEAFRADGKPLLLLMGAVGLVLLIGCANVANLMLARGLARSRATAVRAALGAGRLRLISLPLLESLWLGLIAGALGLAISVWMTDLLLALRPELVPHWHRVSLNAAVIGFALLVAVGVAIGIGILPALRAFTPNLATLLREGGERGSDGPTERRLRSWLVTGQVALAFLLAVGSLLLVRTLSRLSQVDPGFAPNHLLVSSLTLSDTRFPDDASQRLAYDRALDGIRTIPGVLSAALVTTLPLNPVGIDHDLPVTVTGVPTTGEPPQADFRIATPGYFQTLGAPLIRGREFTDQDVRGAQGVMVINQTMARQFFEGDPIGREVSIPGGKYLVVGIAGDVHHRGLDAPPRPEMFVPVEQYYAYGHMNLLVRTMGEVGFTATAIRQAVYALDPDQPVGAVRTMEELVGDSVAGRRFVAWLLTALATLGLGLAAVGVYAVMALTTTQRRRELGIRLALGAAPESIAARVLRQTLVMVLPGVGLGLVASLFATRMLQSQLFEVGPVDLLSLGGAALLLTAVAMLAGWLPARRAARIDPMTTLGSE